MANDTGGGRDGGGDGGGQGGSGDSWYDQVAAAIPGAPDALVHQIADMLRNDNTDAGWGQMFSYLRTTDWFNTAYAGFNQGAGQLFENNVDSKGAFVNAMQGYRNWRTQASQSWQNYYGRDITATELMDFGSRGYGNSVIDQIGQGHSFAMSQGTDWQYYARNFGGGGLSDSDLQAYGELLAGRGSSLGISIQQRLDQAKAKVASLFQGQSGGLGQSASGGFAPSLSGGVGKQDIGA